MLDTEERFTSMGARPSKGMFPNNPHDSRSFPLKKKICVNSRGASKTLQHVGHAKKSLQSIHC